MNTHKQNAAVQIFLIKFFLMKVRMVIIASIMLYLVCGVFASEVFAGSQVFIQNNTSKVLELNIVSSLGSEYWTSFSQSPRRANPGQRLKLFRTNRDSGVKNGVTYEFTTSVTVRDPVTNAVLSQPNRNVDLKLRLRGSTVGSHMWQAVLPQFGSLKWYDDRVKRNVNMTVGDRQWNVKYWAYATGHFEDDVEYVFQEKLPLPVSSERADWNKLHLNVLTYNIYMRGFPFVNGQRIRANLIPDKIRDYDVVVFQEAFIDDIRELFKEQLADVYPYSTNVIGEDRFPPGKQGLDSSPSQMQDGGVFVMSKWPIEASLTDQKLFGLICGGADCLADKGVQYVKINKPSKPGGRNYFHIFATHLNDGADFVQDKQLNIINDFIASKSIPKNEPVLIAGDLNINMYSDRFVPMLDVLNAGYFEGDQLRGYKYTHDGRINDLGSGSRSYYDYVLYSKGHRKPTSASFAEVRMIRADDEWKEFPHENAMWDISDHFPVYASYHFEEAPISMASGGSTSSLTRYWNADISDFLAISDTTNGISLRESGYVQIGTHGQIFKTEEAGNSWLSSAEADTSGNRPRIKIRRQEDVVSDALRGTRTGVDQLGASQALSIRQLRPLKLYYNDSLSDYYSTASPASGESAVRRFEGYRELTTLGFIVNSKIYSSLSIQKKKRLVPLYTYYSDVDKDYLLATNTADIAHAEENQYDKVRLEGYILNGWPLDAEICSASSECSSGECVLISGQAHGFCRAVIN